MKKLLINLGNRGGYVAEILSGRVHESDFNSKKLFEFSATNAEKECLYQVYEKLESLIVRVLATLTRTGKTKVVLVNDNFCEVFEREARNIETAYCKHVVFKIYR